MTNINIAASASTAQSSPDHGGADQPEELIWNTLIQLSSALAYCHYGIPYTESLMEAALGQADSKGVCHRDLTPSNVFLVSVPLSDELQVKLGDFGLAVDLQGGPAKTWTGTGDFIDPEIAQGNEKVEWTVKSDIYSLGCR